MIQGTDARATWLRSLGWRETADCRWSGQVIATKGRYLPMLVDRAFEVALKRSVTDNQFHVEVEEGRVRLATPWREVRTLENELDAIARRSEERPDALR